MNGDHTDDAIHVLSGDLVSGQELTVSLDDTLATYIVEDELSRPVALLPVVGPGEVRTRYGDWRTAVERDRGAWRLTARRHSTGELAATSTPRWLPAAYRFWIAPEWSFRLHSTPLTGKWILRGAGGRVAKLDLNRAFHSRPTDCAPIQGRLEVGLIETPVTAIAGPQFALMIAMAIETIKADRSIPGVGEGGSGLT